LPVDSLNDEDCHFGYCRLVLRLHTSFMQHGVGSPLPFAACSPSVFCVAELVLVDGYDEWMNMIAGFTIKSLQSRDVSIQRPSR